MENKHLTLLNELYSLQERFQTYIDEVGRYRNYIKKVVDGKDESRKGGIKEIDQLNNVEIKLQDYKEFKKLSKELCLTHDVLIRFLNDNLNKLKSKLLIKGNVMVSLPSQKELLENFIKELEFNLNAINENRFN